MLKTNNRIQCKILEYLDTHLNWAVFMVSLSICTSKKDRNSSLLAGCN